MIMATTLLLYKELVQLKPNLLLNNLEPTKRPEVLICYDFHFGIFDEKHLMFAI
jgi:hypothetical protein